MKPVICKTQDRIENAVVESGRCDRVATGEFQLFWGDGYVRSPKPQPKITDRISFIVTRHRFEAKHV
jgi:hypothetical protein